MIKTTVICGGSAVREYDEYGEVPSREWLDEHGGVVEEKEFRTQEEYNAYSMGLADAAEWDDTMLLCPVFSENAATDCSHCREWRAFFSDRKSDVYCPDCGKLILNHPTDDSCSGGTGQEAKSRLWAFVWNFEHMPCDVSDEELIKAWRTPNSNDFLVQRYTPDEIAKQINNELFNDMELYIRFIEMK